MRFGKSATEAKAEPRRGGGDFMSYPKAGDNLLRILDEQTAWVYFWEHYNPDGYPYPCNSDDRKNCPGCMSDNERVRKASRKAAFHAYDGQFVNVWKVPITVADKLEMRSDRLGTITDRDYLITQYKKDNGFFDYEVEGQEKSKFSEDYERKDIEELLQEAWNNAWGTDAKNASAKPSSSKVRNTPRLEIVPDEPAKSYTEKDLRKMEPWDLADLCKKEGFGEIPQEASETSDKIVDWMLSQ